HARAQTGRDSSLPARVRSPGQDGPIGPKGQGMLRADLEISHSIYSRWRRVTVGRAAPMNNGPVGLHHGTGDLSGANGFDAREPGRSGRLAELIVAQTDN